MKIVKKIPGYLGAITRHSKILIPRLTLSRILNLLIMSMEMITKRKKLISRPAFAKIEASSACNLLCKGCRTGTPLMEFPAGNLSPENFKIIIEKIGKYLLEIVFYIWGEPLMNKKLPELIRIAHDYNISVIISTNLHFLSEDLSRELLECKLDKMIFCIDGWSQESYSSIRIGGDFELVKKNIKRFIDLKKESHCSKPFLEWQYVVTENNKNELEKARNIAKEWKIDRFVELVDWSKRLNDEEYFGGLKKVRGKMKIETNRCFWLWSSLSIQYDGTVFPCCHVANKPHERRIYGNLVTQDLDKVWNGPMYQKSRLFLSSNRSIDEGDFICKSCMSPPIYTGKDI